jgi:ABC transporter domain protein
LDKVANKILAFEEGGVREFFGNYTDYLDEKAFLQEQSALLEKEKEQASVKVEKVKEDKKRMSYFEKQEWATIEDEIADLEAKIEEIEAAMLENASDYGQLATLQRDLDAANETLLEKYERYEYLSELEG